MFKGVATVAAALLFCQVAWVGAVTFTVTKLDDTNDGSCDADCSLREAVIAANNSAGLDEILLPPGTIVYSIAGTGEDAAETGDLNIVDSVDIIGDPAQGTTVDADELDRVFQVTGVSTVATFENLTIRNGLSGGSAAGIDIARATVILRHVFMTSNVANPSGGGGGLWVDLFASLTLENSTVAGNSPNEVRISQSDMVATNSTVGLGSGSTGGNGIVVGGGGTVGLTNVTVYRDPPTKNPITAFNPSTVTLRDSILRGECFIGAGAVVISEGGNIESPGMGGSSACGLIQTTDQVVDHAGIQLLDFNGGLTPTHGLASSSPAIGGAFHCPPPATDQRDEPRTDGECDSGSLEVQPADDFPILTDGFESGDTSAWSSSVP